MKNEPGIYDDICTRVREETEAAGVVLLVAYGKKGHGFSIQLPHDLFATLPAVLRGLANEVEKDLGGKH